MASLIAHALYSGLVHAFQQRRLALLPLWALAILGYWLGKLWARWKNRQERRALLLNSAPGGCVAAAAHPATEPTALLLPGGPAPAPICAVVVPAHVLTEQQGAHLHRLITRLALEQERHPSYLILVDDCSPLPLSSLIPAACRQLSDAHPSLVVERLPSRRGPAAARNAGLLLAASMGAQVALLTGGGCLPERGWVGSMLAAQARRPGIVVGATSAARPVTAAGRFYEAFSPSSLLASAGNMSVALPPGPLRPAEVSGATGPQGRGTMEQPQAGAAPREAAAGSKHPAAHDRLALFDESLAGHSFVGLEYLVSALKAGRSISYAHQARVSLPADSGGAAALFWQFVALGGQEGALQAKHPLYAAWLEQAGLMHGGNALKATMAPTPARPGELTR